MNRILVYVMLIVVVVSSEWWVNDITTITSDNISDVLGRHKMVVVKFFTPWCYFCEKMNAEYVRLYQHYQDHEQVLIAKVNCQDQDNLCQYFGVNGYPQIWQFKPNSIRKGDRYTGIREVQPMKEWIQSHSQQTHQQLEINQQNEQQQQDRKSHCVGIFENIFGMFEQMENQNIHLEDKLTKLEQEVNQVQNEDQILLNRISFEKQQFHWGQAVFILVLGVLMAISSFYLILRFKNKISPQQILP